MSDIAERVERLNFRLAELKEARAGGYFDTSAEIERLEEQRDELVAIAKWYREAVKSVLAITGKHGTVTTERRIGDVVAAISTKPGPEDLLQQAAKRYGDLPGRLHCWFQLLLQHGWLTSLQQVSDVSLVQPISPQAEERRRKEREERAAFDKAFQEIIEMAKQHAPRTAQWTSGEAFREALRLWNHHRYERNDDDLRKWLRQLSAARLIPVGNWARLEAGQAVKRLKSLVGG